MLKQKNRNCYKIILMIEITVAQYCGEFCFCLTKLSEQKCLHDFAFRPINVMFTLVNYKKICLNYKSVGETKNFKNHCNWLK